MNLRYCNFILICFFFFRCFPVESNPSFSLSPSSSSLSFEKTISAPLQENSYLQELVDRMEKNQIYQMKHWKRLLRYKKNIWGQEESEIDSERYFLSSSGRTDAREEMISTLKSFFEEEPSDPIEMHPQCVFPERFFWLRSVLHLDSSRLNFRNCSRFEEWKKVLDSDHIRLVFASYYMQSPASMFGHSLIKINSKSNQSSELLDYGVNFAADPGNISPVSYMIGGLTGGYKGSFRIFPYYLKVNEYNHLESRDLWEYKLTFNEEERQRFLRHLWEMGRAEFDYFFLSENCAYQLIRLLEVAKPSLDISLHSGKIVTPSGTLHSFLEENGLVSEIIYRPSLEAKIQEKWDFMSEEEREIFLKVFKEKEGMNPETWKGEGLRKTLILDALILSRQFQKAKSEEGTKEDSRYMEMLLERSKQKEEEEIFRSERKVFSPDHSHSLSRVSLGYGNSNLGNFTELQYRIAYHDLLNSSKGQAPHSELEFFSTKLRKYEDKKPEWTSMDVIKLSSLSPYHPVSDRMSYSFQLGWETVIIPERKKSVLEEVDLDALGNSKTNSVRKQAAHLEAMTGYSFSNPLFGKKENSLFSLLGGMKAQGSSYFYHGKRFGPQISAQYLYEWGDFKIHLSYGYQYYLISNNTNNFTTGIKLRYSLSKDHEFRIEYNRQRLYDEYLISYHFLF